MVSEARMLLDLQRCALRVLWWASGRYRRVALLLARRIGGKLYVLTRSIALAPGNSDERDKGHLIGCR